MAMLWQVLGISDLAMAVTLGTLARVISPQGIPTSAMTVLPLSLIPTFTVPLLLILHVISIAQARAGRRARSRGLGSRYTLRLHETTAERCFRLPPLWPPLAAALFSSEH